MVIKTSIVYLLIILYMGWIYFKNKHIPVKSTMLFKGIYASVLIFCIFDMITIYTVNHIDTVDATLNLVVHIGYLLAINCYIFLLLLYLRSYATTKYPVSKAGRIFQYTQFTVISLLILVLPLDYIKGSITNYSMGAKVYALYTGLILNNIFILYYSLKYWKILKTEKRQAIVAAVPIFVMTTVINIFMPESLFTGAGMVLILIGLVISNENYEMYIVKETGMFNQYALKQVLNEYVHTDKNYFAAIICFSDTEDLSTRITVENLRDLLKKMERYAYKELRINGYQVGSNGCVFLTNTRKEAENLIDQVHKNFETSIDGTNYLIKTMYLSCNEYENENQIFSQINSFCSKLNNRMAYFDYLTGIKNRNAFEEEFETIEKDNSNIYYFIADLNNLKITNDTMGHAAGDELLQGMANILLQATRKQGEVFRLGGDEFVVLWSGESPIQLINSLAKERDKWNVDKIVVVDYAIGYCSLQEENCINIADKMMFEDKKEAKRRKFSNNADKF